MFTTEAIDEVCMGSESLLSSDTKLWRRISTASPFFQVAGAPGLIGTAEEEVLFISDPYDLARLAASVRRIYNSEIGEVMIFTPHSVNGLGRWENQILYAMFFVSHKLNEKTGLVYITSDGIYGVAREEELSQYHKEVLYQSENYALNLFDDYIDTRRI